jgi:uncharacterized protein (UPF0332 family)
MPLPVDLMRHARELATRRGRPSQVNLRRATSAAYYALFHLFVNEVIERMVPSEPPILRLRAARAVQHGEIKQVCIDFRNPPKKLQPLLGQQVSSELRVIAKIFIDLQDDRHTADYDVSVHLSQSAVLNSVTNAETAFDLWKRLRLTSEANIFLAAIVFGKRWDR